jgi:hypothetical protein
MQTTILSKYDNGFKKDISLEEIAISFEGMEKDFSNISYEKIVISNEASIVDSIKSFFKAIWDFIVKTFNKIKSFFIKSEKNTEVVNEEIDKTAEKIKQVKSGKKGKKGKKVNKKGHMADNTLVDISLEDIAGFAINPMSLLDLKNTLKDEVSLNELNGLIKKFTKTTSSLNSYFNNIDGHLKTFPDIDKPLVTDNELSKIVNQVKNKPHVPSDMSVKEFDFYRVGKIGLSEADDNVNPKDVNKVVSYMNANVPRVIQNLSINNLNLSTIQSSEELGRLADEWYVDLQKIKSENRLSSQYIKIGIEILEKKKDSFLKVNKTIDSILSEGKQDKINALKEYANVIKSQINYTQMYINVMTFYHNANNKIAMTVNKIINKILDAYLMAV